MASPSEILLHDTAMDWLVINYLDSSHVPVPFDLCDCFALRGSLSEDQSMKCDIVIYNKKYIFGLQICIWS